MAVQKPCCLITPSCFASSTCGCLLITALLLFFFGSSTYNHYKMEARCHAKMSHHDASNILHIRNARASLLLLLTHRMLHSTVMLTEAAMMHSNMSHENSEQARSAICSERAFLQKRCECFFCLIGAARADAFGIYLHEAEEILLYSTKIHTTRISIIMSSRSSVVQPH